LLLRCYSAYFFFISDEIVSGEQLLTIRTQNDQIIFLRKFTAQRVVNEAGCVKDLEGQPIPSHVQIWINPEVPDASTLAIHVLNCLMDAHWPVDGIDPIPDPPSSVPKYLSRAEAAGGLGNGGVTVVSNHADGIAGNALAEALFNNSTAYGMGQNHEPYWMPVPAGTLRVVIGPKSEPLEIPRPPPGQKR
jgi:hypothetical protein